MSSDRPARREPGEVRFEGVSKLYASGRRGSGVSDAIPGRRRTVSGVPIVAVDDVSFALAPGETLGIIGPNGAGKSTLLKMLAGVIAPTEGTVGHGGRLGQMIELGIGFHPDLTGWENVRDTATLLGFSDAELAEKVDDIAEFSGIRPALDSPVKHYSTGMKTRLGFAIAVELDVDILAIDEVLAVGDREFQAQCVARMRDKVERGATLLVATHDMGVVEQLCARAIHIRRGQIRHDGPAVEVIESYLSPDPRHYRRVAKPPLELRSFVLSTEEVEKFDRIGLRADMAVSSSVAAAERAQVVVSFTLPRVAPGHVFARWTGSLPAEALVPGEHTLRGRTSPLPMEGGFVQVSLSLVDGGNLELIDEREAAFRVVGGHDTNRPYFASRPAVAVASSDPMPAQLLEPTSGGPRSGAEVVLWAAGLDKWYQSGQSRPHARMAVPGPWGAPPRGDVPALDLVDFDLAYGEAVGVIGPNGAGKSTLLKALAGIVRPSEGTVAVAGRVISILELGLGFDPDCTGWENIELSAALLRIPRTLVAERMPVILEFAGIGDAMDRPVKRYSSGMRARLGFAIAVNSDPDVLLIDELLAVGDEEFRAKAVDQIAYLRDSGVSVVFVSHNLWLVEQLCTRAIRIEHGRVVDIGPSGDVVDRYGGSGWMTVPALGTTGIRIHGLSVTPLRLPAGGDIAVSGWVQVDVASPTARLELSYRDAPHQRDRALDAAEIRDRTVVVWTLSPAGGILAAAGWYRFEGIIEQNLFDGRFDVVISAVDQLEGEILAEDSQTVIAGAANLGYLGMHLDVEWEVDGGPVAAPQAGGGPTGRIRDL